MSSEDFLCNTNCGVNIIDFMAIVLEEPLLNSSLTEVFQEVFPKLLSAKINSET